MFKYVSWETLLTPHKDTYTNAMFLLHGSRPFDSLVLPLCGRD
jgi:hypothetical protein